MSCPCCIVYGPGNRRPEHEKSLAMFKEQIGKIMEEKYMELTNSKLGEPEGKPSSGTSKNVWRKPQLNSDSTSEADADIGVESGSPIQSTADENPAASDELRGINKLNKRIAELEAALMDVYEYAAQYEPKVSPRNHRETLERARALLNSSAKPEGET